MTDLKFVPFTEENDWEGETWRFWLQLTGNEAEIEKLGNLLIKQATGEDGEKREIPYSIDLSDELTEAEVDLLVDHAHGTSYMSSETKVTGTFTCPEGPDVHADQDDGDDDPFYKGGITELFTTGDR